MISKKKVTALALAGLFVTPVLAATEVKYNEIRSGDGYLTAGDKLFSQALENSRNRTDSSKDAVKRERQKFCVHGIIGARQTGASNEHEHQTQFS